MDDGYINKHGLWECARCGFAFAQIHVGEDGSYTCPVCALEAAQAEAAVMRTAIKSFLRDVEITVPYHPELVDGSRFKTALASTAGRDLLERHAREMAAARAESKGWKDRHDELGTSIHRMLDDLAAERAAREKAERERDEARALDEKRILERNQATKAAMKYEHDHASASHELNLTRRALEAAQAEAGMLKARMAGGDWLPDWCAALGWQGGTIHDAIREVRRMRDLLERHARELAERDARIAELEDMLGRAQRERDSLLPKWRP